MKTSNIFGLKIAYDCVFVWTASEISGGRKRGGDGESKRKKNNVKEKYLSPCSLVSILAKKEKGVFYFFSVSSTCPLFVNLSFGIFFRDSKIRICLFCPEGFLEDVFFVR